MFPHANEAKRPIQSIPNSNTPSVPMSSVQKKRSPTSKSLALSASDAPATYSDITQNLKVSKPVQSSASSTSTPVPPKPTEAAAASAAAGLLSSRANAQDHLEESCLAIFPPTGERDREMARRIFAGATFSASCWFPFSGPPKRLTQAFVPRNNSPLVRN